MLSLLGLVFTARHGEEYLVRHMLRHGVNSQNLHESVSADAHAPVDLRTKLVWEAPVCSRQKLH